MKISALNSLRSGIIVSLSAYMVFFASCVSTKKTAYFNNIPDSVIQSPEAAASIIGKNDMLNITVSSLNPTASLIFNVPNVGATPSTSTSGVTGGITSTSQLMGYLVGQDGTIKFPVLGNISAAGLTKKQLEDTITTILAEKKLLVDPIVNVRFLNFRVTVLGEVAKPTTINVANEKISILEALGLAGDLTIYAKRDNVLLIREEENQKVVRRIDLNSENVLSSPYYYLKNNDVLYVEPGKAKVATTSNTRQLLPVILSGLSFAAIILDRIIK